MAGGISSIAGSTELTTSEVDKRIDNINAQMEKVKKDINTMARHELERLSAARQLLQAANKEYLREYACEQNQMNWFEWWVVESFRTKTQERLEQRKLEEKIAVIERDLGIVNALENNQINKIEELLQSEESQEIKGVLEGLLAKLGKFGQEDYKQSRTIEGIEITLDYDSNLKPKQNKAALEAILEFCKTELKEVRADKKGLRLLELEKDLIFIKQYKQSLTDEQEANGASDELMAKLSQAKSTQYKIEQGLNQGKLLERVRSLSKSA